MFEYTKASRQPTTGKHRNRRDTAWAEDTREKGNRKDARRQDQQVARQIARELQSR